MQKTQGSPTSITAWLRQPIVVTVLLVAYIGITFLILRDLSVRRGDILLFPLLSTIFFPPFVLSPFVILFSPLTLRWKAALIALVMIVAIPVLGLYDSSYLELVIQICIFSGLALGLNIVVGFAGLLDLGYIAFFAVGAYLWAMFTSSADTIFQVNGLLVPGWAFFLFLGLGVLAAGLGGILLGLPVLRLRGDYLAIVTLGFGEMIRVLARNLDQPINLTNGSQGLHNVAQPPLPNFLIDLVAGIDTSLGIPIDNAEPLARQMLFYFIAILIVAIIIVVARRLDNSAIGRAWTAIREDEVAAIAMGVPLVRMKLLAFASGASFAGAIGVLYAAKQQFVSPESFSLIQSISILAMVIVGGLGGIKGVLLGAAVVTLLNLQVLTNFALQLNALRNIDYVVPIVNFHISDWPTQLTPDKYQRFIFGLLLIFMMIFRPAGILPEPRRKLELMIKDEPVIEEDPIQPAAAPSGGTGGAA